MEWTTGEGSVPAVRCVAEATRPLPFVRTFDRVLADVPCSGTGTLGRNPEIRWRLLPRDIEDFRNRQVRILSHALKLLAPGGRLVYSTCSLEPEENEAVVQEVVREFGAGLQLLQEHRRTPGVDAGDGFYAAVITSNEPAS
jgi:16S rRNA (cytosine967-C5)-methyltransferase